MRRQKRLFRVRVDFDEAIPGHQAMNAKSLVLTKDQIEQLYALSELSTKAHRNNLRVSQGPEASSYREKAQAYKRTKLRLEALGEDLRALEDERQGLEKDLNSYEAQLKVSKGRLEHSTGGDFRSLPALQVEIYTLESKVGEYTDAELGLMEQLEVLGRERDLLEIEMKRELQDALAAKEELEALRADVAHLDQTLQSDIAKLRSAIEPDVAALLERVPTQIIDKVAFVIDLSCSGCRLRISSILMDRIKRFGGEVHYCEECGRMLLPERDLVQ